ncbi:MAG: hypothetical protein MZV70_12910 [Desulfobacterales bacterium]|nr:hypothetical protein [Desulfobacterales bacterium]
MKILAVLLLEHRHPERRHRRRASSSRPSSWRRLPSRARPVGRVAALPGRWRGSSRSCSASHLFFTDGAADFCLPAGGDLRGARTRGRRDLAVRRPRP